MNSQEIEFIEERILELSETRSQLDLSISLLENLIIKDISNKRSQTEAIVGLIVKITGNTYFHKLDTSKAYRIDSYEEDGDTYIIDGWIVDKEDFEII